MASPAPPYAMGQESFEFVGKLHPLLVHFPIALLVTSAGIECWRLVRESASVRACGRLVAVAGSLTAVAAALTGWIFAREIHRTDTATLLAQHRWTGVTTVVLAVVACILVLTWNEVSGGGKAWCRRAAVWLASAALVLASHLGASLVWGSDFFSS